MLLLTHTWTDGHSFSCVTNLVLLAAVCSSLTLQRKYPNMIELKRRQQPGLVRQPGGNDEWLLQISKFLRRIGCGMILKASYNEELNSKDQIQIKIFTHAIDPKMRLSQENGSLGMVSNMPRPRPAQQDHFLFGDDLDSELSNVNLFQLGPSISRH